MKIKVEGKGLVFANFFGKTVEGKTEYAFDVPKEERYSKYSLNNEEGQKNTAEYKAKEYQCGYVQTGNMSLAVWQSRDKDEVLIVEENDEELFDESDVFMKKFKEKKATFKKQYKRLGEVSCDVWRVEFVGEKRITEGIFERNSAYNEKDRVFAKLSKGNYSIKHHSVRGSKVPYETWVTIKKS